MRWRRVAFVLLAALAAATPSRSAPAQTQFDVTLPLNYIDINAGAFAEAAFSQPYGRLLVAQLAAVIGESADAQCLKAAGIGKTQIAGRARTMLVSRGKQVFEKVATTYDRTMLLAKLVARGSANAIAERRRLRSDPAVRAYIAMAQPMVLAGAPDS